MATSVDVCVDEEVSGARSCESERNDIFESGTNVSGQRCRAYGDNRTGTIGTRRSPRRMAAATESQVAEKEEGAKGKKVIVVGGGWAGRGKCSEAVEFS